MAVLPSVAVVMGSGEGYNYKEGGGGHEVE